MRRSRSSGASTPRRVFSRAASARAVSKTSRSARARNCCEAATTRSAATPIGVVSKFVPRLSLGLDNANVVYTRMKLTIA